MIGTILLSVLASSQGQSLLRSALKIGGTLLVAHGGADPAALDTIIGGVVALVGVLHSVNAHAPEVQPRVVQTAEK